MTQTLSVVQLPCTQGADRYSLKHPVTALKSTLDHDLVSAQTDAYLSDPKHFGLSNTQLYLAQYYRLLIDHETGVPRPSVDVTDTETDIALAGHLLSQARVMRHVMGRFTAWLSTDPAIDWEKQSIAWFEAVMNPDLVVPEGYGDALEVIRSHMCISMTNNYVKEVYPGLSQRAEEYLDAQDQGLPCFIDLAKSGGFRIYPLLESFTVTELSKLLEWATDIKASEGDVEGCTGCFVIPKTVKIKHGNGEWLYLSASSDAHGHWFTIQSYRSLGGESFRPLTSKKMHDFAVGIIELLTEKGTVEQSKVQVVAPRVGAMELFMKTSGEPKPV